MNENNRKILIHAVGDIMLGDHPHFLGMGIGSRIRKGKIKNPFNKIKSILKKGDIVFGNLETVLSKKSNRIGLNRIDMRGDPEWEKLIQDAGFNILSVANNHALQHGIPAWEDSIKNICNAGIQVIGIKQNPILFIECKGIKIAVLSFSLRPPQYVFSSPPYYLASDKEIQDEIRRAKQKVDIVILSLHWGDEYSPWPSPEQVKIGQSFIDCGATIIVGHHPHVLQGIQKKDNHVIAYSLGNFVSDMTAKRARETVILSAYLDKNGVDKLELIPVIIGEDSCPHIAEKKDGSVILESVSKYNSLISLSKKPNAQILYLKGIEETIRGFRCEFIRWFIGNWQRYSPIALFWILGGITTRKLLVPINILRRLKRNTNEKD